MLMAEPNFGKLEVNSVAVEIDSSNISKADGV